MRFGAAFQLKDVVTEAGLNDRADVARPQQLYGVFQRLGKLPVGVMSQAALLGVRYLGILLDYSGKIAAVGHLLQQPVGFFPGVDSNLSHPETRLIRAPGAVLVDILLYLVRGNMDVAQND